MVEEKQSEESVPSKELIGQVLEYARELEMIVWSKGRFKLAFFCN